MQTPTNSTWADYQAPRFRILYVGSDPDFLSALRKAAGKPEYHIVSCPDRDSAIVFLKSDISYHLVLLDIEMRDAAALELAELTRSLAHRGDIPIVIVANEVTSNLEERARSAGADACITKAQDISVAVERILRRLR